MLKLPNGQTVNLTKMARLDKWPERQRSVKKDFMGKVAKVARAAKLARNAKSAKLVNSPKVEGMTKVNETAKMAEMAKNPKWLKWLKIETGRSCQNGQKK